MGQLTTTPTKTSVGKTRLAAEVVAEALTAHPGCTAADLTTLTGLGTSTVTKTLAALEKAGQARRTTPEATGTAGARRPAARWQHVSATSRVHPEQPAARRHRPTSRTGSATAGTRKARTSPKQPVAPSVEGQPETEATVVAAADEHTTGRTPARTGRLGKGELGALVLEYLIAHAGDDPGPTAIGKALNRSLGAVANALTKFAAAGDIVQTSEQPRRYRLVG